MEIHQYQPGEKRAIDKTIGTVISPHTQIVRGCYNTKHTDFDYQLYDKSGKKVIVKIF